MLKLINFQINSIKQLFKFSEVKTFKSFIFCFIYYFFTIVVAILDGLGALLLVGVFLKGPIVEISNTLSKYLLAPFNLFNSDNSANNLLILIIIIYLILLVLKIIIAFLDQYIWTYFRSKLQNKIYYNYLNANWLQIYDFKVGDVSGTLSWEVRAIAKYLQNLFKLFYNLFLSLIFILMAIYTSFKISLISAVLVSPLILLFIYISKQLAFFSKREAEARNNYMSDITERLNGLFQIISENNISYHFKMGAKEQKKLWRLELLQGFFQSITSVFNIILIFFGLIFFYVYTLYTPFAYENLAVFASIGVLGIKLLGSLNSLVSSAGNMLRLSGSINPVINCLKLNSRRITKEIQVGIKKIILNKIEFNFDNSKNLIKEFSIKIEINQPLIISGQSGSGKTTLANIISGIYLPSKGEVKYLDINNESYDSRYYHFNIGYVTQNIHLFRGTIKEFLTQNVDLDNSKINQVIKQVGLNEFVNSIGGINSHIVESGRGFSGGQIRRLGIAKVLLSNSKVIILDEPTAGLDKKNKDNLMQTIEDLSKKYIIIIISHDNIDLKNCKKIDLDNI